MVMAMDYEQKYKQVLERAREYHKVDYDNTLRLYARGTMEYLFPELKKSEDEKIRKRILLSLEKDLMATKNSGCNTKDLEECIAWLEKQGEQKSTIEMKSPEESLGIDSDTYNKIVDECIYGEQNSAWSEEDTFKVQRICKYLDEAKKYYADITEVRDCVDWLKSLKERMKGE